MPPFYGTNLTDRLKPAATILGVSDRALPSSGVVSVFSCQTFGRGRTFAMATDSTIAWGRDFETSWGEGDNRYFRKFWRNVVRWLTENSDSSDRRLRVETDKVIYRPGQEIQVTARAYNDELKETDRYRVVAVLHAATGDPSRLGDPAGSGTNLVPDIKDGTYRGRLKVPQASELLVDPGSTIQKVRLDVAAMDGELEVSRSLLDLQVIDDPAEFQDPRPDPARLQELAQATGGQVIHRPEELATLLAQAPPASVRVEVTRWPLWDTPLLWLLVLGLLSTEWILRRLKGLA
jgi:hypothetical protein